MTRYKTSDDIAASLKARLGYRGQNEMARELGVSKSRLSDFLAGNRPVSRSILIALGYDTTPLYRKRKIAP